MNKKFSVSNAADSKEQAAAAINEAVAHRLDELEKGINVELAKTEIKDGDVYMVKMIGDEFDEATVVQFKKALKGKFPKVEFIVLALPSNHNVEMKKL
jgi:hypothetical protein